MATPSSRQSLIDYCLRKLGAPVLEINVDDDQISDRIDDALQYWQEFHVDATMRLLLKYQVTADDITNKSITVPSYITIIERVIRPSTTSSGLFGLNNQFIMNDFFNLGFSGNLHYYSETMDYIKLLEMIVGGGDPVINHSRHSDKLHIDWGWDRDVVAGNYIILDCYRIIDPATSPKVYNDHFLKKYATALIKRQWATNIKKFEGVQLPGGITLNGQQMFDESIEEIRILEEEMQTTWVEPVDFYLG